MEQLQAGHVAVFPLSAICHLQKLCISLLAEILQTGRKPRLIYNFLCSGINKLARAAAHKDSMPFVKSLHSLLDCIIAVYPALGSTYLCKVDLADAYTRI